MPGMRTYLVAVLAMTGSAGAVQASERPDQLVFYHNGSTMAVQTDQRNNIGISYARPRAGLPARPGDQLFGGTLVSGTWRSGRISGTANVFRKGCEPASYQVTGSIRDEGPNVVVTLSGAAPIRAQGGCKVVGYSKSSSSARLIIESGVDE